MIELQRSPRYKDATEDTDCVWYLIVNGYTLGAWYGGKKRHYEDKEKWAEMMIKKRIPVLERNIGRLRKEMQNMENELEAIKNRPL